MKNKIVSSITALSLIGCATSKNPNDPYEHYNRKVFMFNMLADHYVLRPVAVGYSYVPEPVRDAISNFYNNLRDFVTLGNDILQLNGEDTMHNTMRIAINSTFGILGLIDVSSSLGLPQTKTSFGDTFRRWGWQNSSYFLIPLLGPGTVRDDLGLIPDIYFNPLFWITNDPWISWGIFTINLVNQRASVLDQDKLLMSSIDPYATIRDVYLQRNGAYIYPNQDESAIESAATEESIDEMIDEENHKTSPKQSKIQREDAEIDALIDEENKSVTATPTVAAATTLIAESAGKMSASNPYAQPIHQNTSTPIKIKVTASLAK